MKMKLEVNKALVPMKAHYFLWNSGMGSVIPYLSIYVRQLGFSSVIVGLIYTILPVFGMIAKPTFGAIADRFHCQKLIFLTAQIVTATAFFTIFYAPEVPNNKIVDFSCSGSEAVFHSVKGVVIDTRLVEKIQNKQVLTKCELACHMPRKNLGTMCKNWKLSHQCDNSSFTLVLLSAHVTLTKTEFFQDAVLTNGKNATKSVIEFRAANVTHNGRIFNRTCFSSRIKTSCEIECSDQDVHAVLSMSEIFDKDVYGNYQFWVLLLLMTTSWCGQAVGESIGDTICFGMLGDKPNRYGYQRMFGALGFGIFSLLTGILVDVFSEGKSYTDYKVCFYFAALFLVLDLMVSSQLKYTQTKLSANILEDVGKLLVNIRIIVFLMWCVGVGMCTGLIWQFLLWLVEDLADVRGETRVQTLQGIIMGVQCLGGEFPFFFLSGKILKKIGHVNAMSLVLFTLGIRLLLYSIIKNPWYFIPIEFSSGLTFGLFHACMASYVSIVAPAGTEATMQGLVGAIFEGAGLSLGGLLGGLALSRISGSLTFRYFGLGSLAACVIHIIVQYLLKSDGNAKGSKISRI